MPRPILRAGVPPDTSGSDDSLQRSSSTGHFRGAFSRVARFYARSHCKHGTRSYPLDRATGRARLRAGLFRKHTWTATR